MHIKMFTSAYKNYSKKMCFKKCFFTVTVSSLSSLNRATDSTDWQRVFYQVVTRHGIRIHAELVHLSLILLPSRVSVRAKMSMCHEITTSATESILFLTERVLIQCMSSCMLRGRPISAVCSLTRFVIDGICLVWVLGEVSMSTEWRFCTHTPVLFSRTLVEAIRRRRPTTTGINLCFNLPALQQ